MIRSIKLFIAPAMIAVMPSTVIDLSRYSSDTRSMRKRITQRVIGVMIHMGTGISPAIPGLR